MSKKRFRGHVLTPAGKTQIDRAIRVWEHQHDTRRTKEKLSELTGLNTTTLHKILDTQEGVDRSSIEALFGAFDLPLEETYIRLKATILTLDPHFVGRESAIADLDTLIEQRGAKVIVIQARGGVGKTTLARKYLQQRFNQSFLEIPIAKETQDIASIGSLIEEKLRQLGEEPGREFLVSLDRFKRKLQSEPMGILIDNLEPALDSGGRFIEQHRRYVELLAVLADPSVQAITLITTRERLNEYSISVQHYLLGDLSLEAWKQYFQNYLPLLSLRDEGLENKDQSALAALHKAYGGNAKAMDIVCSAIRIDYASDVSAYWRINQHDLLVERPLEDLVIGQFERLERHDPDAYRLLCRMGCYRYQEVPRVPQNGLLCLLWELPEEQSRRRVIRALQNRSLVEVENGEYWLHPVIRAEAIARLRSLPSEWERANHEAAQFWTESVSEVRTTTDAERALEAFYHYVQVQDPEKAAGVIVRRRKNLWGTNESLGRSFYKLGLLKPIREAIRLVKDELGDGFYRAKLYHTLGATYWLSDNISEAVEYCDKAKEIARGCLFDQHCSSEPEHRHFLKLVEMNSILTIGICLIGLGEHREAMQFHQQARECCAELNDEKYLKSIDFYIAYLNSCLRNPEEARSIADKLYEEFDRLPENHLPSWVTEYRLFFLGMTYKNLGEIEKAAHLYRRGIQYASRSCYGQAHAKALYGQAALDREQGNFDIALDRHRQSINYLLKIGAKYDLAESYYQLGLTYKAMNNQQQSEKAFQNAIQLFTEMRALKQVEKVKRAIESV